VCAYLIPSALRSSPRGLKRPEERPLSLLSDPLYRAPVIDPRTGLLSRPWAEWFAALIRRTGGSGDELTNAELHVVTTQLAAQIAALVAAPSPALGHLRGGPVTPAPSVVPVSAGAGSGATASVVGTDSAGSITLSVAALATRRSNSEICRLTFGTAWTAPPVVLIQPSNDAAYALAFGRFVRPGHAVSVRLVQGAVTSTGWALRVGSQTLPSAAAVYQWSYLSIGV
jgi:hypothetical protein